jgi:hypothetical protein
MIPHKTARGAAAMDRLKVFEGIPPPYDKKQRMVVPQALRVLRLKPGRKYCTVGRLAHEVGWKYQDVVARCVYTTLPLPNMFNPGERRSSDVRMVRLTFVTDSRREEKLRAPHTTSERRLNEDTWARPRSRMRTASQTRSWLSLATRSFSIPIGTKGPVNRPNLFSVLLDLLYDLTSTECTCEGEVEGESLWLEKQQYCMAERYGTSAWCCDSGPEVVVLADAFGIRNQLRCMKFGRSAVERSWAESAMTDVHTSPGV